MPPKLLQLKHVDLNFCLDLFDDPNSLAALATAMSAFGHFPKSAMHRTGGIAGVGTPPIVCKFSFQVFKRVRHGCPFGWDGISQLYYTL